MHFHLTITPSAYELLTVSFIYNGNFEARRFKSLYPGHSLLEVLIVQEVGLSFARSFLITSLQDVGHSLWHFLELTKIAIMYFKWLEGITLMGEY